MRIIDLALKDLSQILRDKRMLLFLIIMPIFFTAFMGSGLQPSESNADARLPIGLINNDGSSLLSIELQKMLADSTVIRLDNAASTDTPTINDRVSSGQLAAALTIPSGFSDKLLADQSISLSILADQSSTGGQAAAAAIQTALTRIFSLAKTANLATKSIGATNPTVIANTVQQASQAWRAPAITIAIEAATAVKTPVPSNPFAQLSPGMIVQFAIFGLITSAMILVIERKTRTLQRLLTTSISRAEIIAGHVLAMFVVVFLQQVILIGTGQFAFGVNYLREPLATLLVMIGLGLWTSSLGLFISTLAKGEEQVVLFSLISMFLFTALAGAWFPLESTGPAFAAIGHLTPGAWAMDGFQNIVVRGLALDSVLLPVGILIAYAILFFGLGVWRFKFE
jgi:ABC-2 type transport system permease protein